MSDWRKGAEFDESVKSNSLKGEVFTTNGDFRESRKRLDKMIKFSTSSAQLGRWLQAVDGDAGERDTSTISAII